MSRSPRKRPTTASSSRWTRRRFVAASLEFPAGLTLVGGIGSLLRDPFQAAPYAVVLGTAQDAGVPQVNCFNANCVAVRNGLRPAPRVASLGLVDPAANSRTEPSRRFLIDATPDFVAQVGALLEHPEGMTTPGGSVRLTDHLQGILLTHAHMGHYTGLVHLGREAAATGELPLFVSASMAAYLSANEPWASLVRNGNVRIHELRPGERQRLSPRLEITPFAVLHRQELSDTLGFLVHGPERTLMYVPDADRWEGWPREGVSGAGGTEPFDYWLGHADVALLDGSFYSYDELGHRPQGEVPHPPISVSMERLADRLGDLQVVFTHFNNTNPVWDPDASQSAAVRAAGYAIAEQGQRFEL